MEPVRILRSEGVDPVVFYANSNIHPAEEYARRLATLREWAADADLEVVEGAYDPDKWEATVDVYKRQGLRIPMLSSVLKPADTSTIRLSLIHIYYIGCVPGELYDLLELPKDERAICENENEPFARFYV